MPKEGIEMNEDLMRGAVARMGQLLEVVATSLGFNAIVAIMALFSVYLVAVVQTPTAYRFAPFVVAGSVAMAAKGSVLLHRKWREYDESERTSQQQPEAWENPSINVATESRAAVGVANFLAVGAILLPVLLYSYAQIYLGSRSMLQAAVWILPSLAMFLASIWAWITAAR
jgi:hypothetical protein